MTGRGAADTFEHLEDAAYVGQSLALETHRVGLRLAGQILQAAQITDRDQERTTISDVFAAKAHSGDGCFRRREIVRSCGTPR